jgi:hypothetical protein
MIMSERWYPTKRADMLVMANVWITALTTQGPAWGVPQTAAAELQSLTTAAETALNTAQTVARDEVHNAKVRLAFAALEANMRDLKKRYFLAPPLAEPDFVILLLHPHDGTRSVIPAPDLEGEGDLKFPDYSIIEVQNIRARGAVTDKRPYDAVKIYFGMTGTPTPQYPYRLSEAPESGFLLPYSARTRRKHHRFEFPGESGNRIYVCVRWQNGKGQEGPYGPVLTAIIP